MLTTKELIAKPTGYLFAFYDESAYFTSTFISFLKDIGLSVADFLKSLTQFTIHHPAQAITLGLAAQMGALSTRSLYSSGDNEFFPLERINFTGSDFDTLLYINNFSVPKFEHNKRQAAEKINLPPLKLPDLQPLPPISNFSIDFIHSNVDRMEERFQQLEQGIKSQEDFLKRLENGKNGKKGVSVNKLRESIHILNSTIQDLHKEVSLKDSIDKINYDRLHSYLILLNYNDLQLGYRLNDLQEKLEIYERISENNWDREVNDCIANIQQGDVLHAQENLLKILGKIYAKIFSQGLTNHDLAIELLFQANIKYIIKHSYANNTNNLDSLLEFIKALSSAKHKIISYKELVNNTNELAKFMKLAYHIDEFIQNLTPKTHQEADNEISILKERFPASVQYIFWETVCLINKKYAESYPYAFENKWRFHKTEQKNIFRVSSLGENPLRYLLVEERFLHTRTHAGYSTLNNTNNKIKVKVDEIDEVVSMYKPVYKEVYWLVELKADNEIRLFSTKYSQFLALASKQDTFSLALLGDVKDNLDLDTYKKDELALSTWWLNKCKLSRKNRDILGQQIVNTTSAKKNEVTSNETEYKRREGRLSSYNP